MAPRYTHGRASQSAARVLIAPQPEPAEQGDEHDREEHSKTHSHRRLGDAETAIDESAREPDQQHQADRDVDRAHDESLDADAPLEAGEYRDAVSECIQLGAGDAVPELLKHRRAT